MAVTARRLAARKVLRDTVEYSTRGWSSSTKWNVAKFLGLREEGGVAVVDVLRDIVNTQGV